jgi:putative spermidine/putrescine transport system permease protein
VRLLLLPAVAVLAVFAAALASLFRWSVLEFVPGSLQTGGLTLANFRGVRRSTWARSATRSC